MSKARQRERKQRRKQRTLPTQIPVMPDLAYELTEGGWNMLRSCLDLPQTGEPLPYTDVLTLRDGIIQDTITDEDTRYLVSIALTVDDEEDLIETLLGCAPPRFLLSRAWLARHHEPAFVPGQVTLPPGYTRIITAPTPPTVPQEGGALHERAS